MSFPRYPEYKDSGVEWLGQVPAHWDAVTLKRISPQMTVGIVVNPSSFVADFGLPYIYGGDIREGRIDLDECRRISVEDSDKNAKTKLAANDLLTVRVGAPGVTAVVPEACTGGNCASVMLIRSGEFDSRWLCYAMNDRVIRYQVEVVQYGAAQEQFNISHAVNFIVPRPSWDEQRGIADYLDHETAKIDALVEEQQRLIELLKEKRQAVISQAVTKGLDPSVPMKDSGVEWLGKVPAHWSVASLGYRYSVQLGKMLDSAKVSGMHLRPYLRVFDVQWGHVNVEELPQMDFDEEDRSKFALLPGDLLVNEGGSYPGRSAIWTGEIEECYYQKALHRLRLLQPALDSSNFFFYVMYWAANTGVFDAGGNEATIQHLPAEKLRRYRMPFPPIAEQNAIAGFLREATARIDELVESAASAVDFLRERRSALISAAVTGKIDVRALAA